MRTNKTTAVLDRNYRRGLFQWLRCGGGTVFSYAAFAGVNAVCARKRINIAVNDGHARSVKPAGARWTEYRPGPALRQLIQTLTAGAA